MTQLSLLDVGPPTSRACRACGRRLTDPASIRDGIGPKCGGRTKRRRVRGVQVKMPDEALMPRLRLTRYTYLGDRFTEPGIKGMRCDPVRRADGKTVRGRGKALVVDTAGRRIVVLARRLRLTEKTCGK